MKLPECPECGKAMLFSFCIMYNEYVCIPCGKAVKFMHGLPRIEITEKEEDKLRKKYRNDLNRLAFTRGGARCKICDSYKGNNCPTCKFPNEFEYWGKKKEGFK